MPVRKDWLYSVLFFILFAAVSIPGIDWGVPSFWHPDELIKNVDKMIRGVYQLDATYFNHPFLPIHVYQVDRRAGIQPGTFKIRFHPGSPSG